MFNLICCINIEESDLPALYFWALLNRVSARAALLDAGKAAQQVTPTKSKFGAQKQLYSTARLRA
jgi:hypothetical protein